MKKIISIMLVLMLIINTSLAYTIRIVIDGVDMEVTGEPGNVVSLQGKLSRIKSWNVRRGGITITDGQFVMPECDVEIEAVMTEATKSLLTVESKYFSRSEQRSEGDIITVSSIISNDSYKFVKWTATGITLTGAQQTNPVITFTMPANAVTLVASYECLPNTPVLTDGLVPVNWNGSSWVETTEANWDYNYDSVAQATQSTVEGNGNGKWANAQTADGSLYVWIPRYTYKITSGEHSDGKSWNSLDDPGSNKIEVKFSNGTTDDTSDSYKKHPAFTFGEDELKGIWVAKYEASEGNTTSTVNKPTSSSYVAQFKPEVSSWRSISVSKAYEYAYSTFRNADSHLMRNSEWGAVAYLTNAIGRIPYINNNSNYITGIAGDTQDTQDASSSTSTANKWNTVKGVKASTTHNVYGIYDLSGGACEYVSAYYTGGNSTYLSSDTSNKAYAGVLYTNRNTKYVETYDTSYTSSKTGDAVYETSSSDSSTTSWDNDYSYAPGSTTPVFLRGGLCLNGSVAGVFYFSRGAGRSSSNYGFRAVLSIK